jgi:hypothetical protein
MVFVFTAFISFFIVLFWSAEKLSKPSRGEHWIRNKSNVEHSAPKSSEILSD